MIINNNNYSIIEIIEMMDRKELTVNKNYQRNGKLWPDSPASYFIDTILERFPFPKIYIYEYISNQTRRMKKEIVDGQQRITTIRRFMNDEFAVKGDSKYSGMRFSNLPEEAQNEFLSYSVSVDVIRNASRSEILQMFRRMNAYTLPLNNAEKRHSTYSGDFKWFINELSDSLNSFFVDFSVFTEKQIVRMLDAELLAEMFIAIEEGIISSSPTHLNNIYKKYEESFTGRNVFFTRIMSVFEFIWTEFEPLRNTFMMKPYALHSLFTALYIARYGIDSVTYLYNINPIGKFCIDTNSSLERIELLADAHETKDWNGRFNTYLFGVDSSTNRISQRTARVFTLLEALGVVIPDGLGYVNVFS